MRLLRLALFAPLTLAMAACGNTEEAAGGAIEGEPIAAVPAPQGTAWRDQVARTQLDGYLIGNPDAPLKLVEYGSLTCPTCARFSEEGFEPLMNDYVNMGTVSFELRNMPVHGTVDIVLARLTRCGAPEAVPALSEQVWGNYETIMQPLQANQPALEAAMQRPMEQRFVAFAEAGNFLDFFAQRGLSEDQARMCLADVASMQKLADDAQQQGEEFNVTGTPTFFLNGQRVDANTWAALEPALQRAGAR